MYLSNCIGLDRFYEMTFEPRAEVFFGDMFLLMRNIAVCATGELGK